MYNKCFLLIFNKNIDNKFNILSDKSQKYATWAYLQK